MCVCQHAGMHTCVYALILVHVSTHCIQKRVLDPPALKLQRVGSHCEGAPMETWSSEMAASSSNHWAITAAPLLDFKYRYLICYSTSLADISKGKLVWLSVSAILGSWCYALENRSQGIRAENTKVAERWIGERPSARQQQVRQMDWLPGRPEHSLLNDPFVQLGQEDKNKIDY